MSCCTGDIINRGCFYSCDLITTGQLASETGVYTLELQPDGIKVVSNTITIGNSIVFSGGYLNEDGVSVFKVLKPDGTYLSVSGNDCFQVDIKPANNPILSNVECPTTDATCIYDIYIDSVFIQQVTLTNCADLTINLV